MKKKNAKKLNLSRETVSNLDPEALKNLGGEAAIACQESHIICSIRHTCVSCVFTQDTCA